MSRCIAGKHRLKRKLLARAGEGIPGGIRGGVQSLSGERELPRSDEFFLFPSTFRLDSPLTSL